MSEAKAIINRRAKERATVNTAVERCVLCGGVLGSFRVLVGGEPFHPRCCSHDGRDHRIEETPLETAKALSFAKLRIADLEAALDVAEAIMTAVAMSPRLCREMIVDDAKLGDALATTRLLLQKRQPE